MNLDEFHKTDIEKRTLTQCMEFLRLSDYPPLQRSGLKYFVPDHLRNACINQGLLEGLFGDAKVCP